MNLASINLVMVKTDVGFVLQAPFKVSLVLPVIIVIVVLLVLTHIGMPLLASAVLLLPLPMKLVLVASFLKLSVAVLASFVTTITANYALKVPFNL